MSLHGLKLVRTVDGLFPLVALYINNNNGLAIACGINGGINLEHRAADAGENGSRHKAAGLSNERPHLHLVALLDNGLGGGTDVLRQRENSLLGQSGYLGSHLVGQLVLFGVYTTYSKCSYVHAFASSFFSGSTLAFGASAGFGAAGSLGFGAGGGVGKLTSRMACFGQTVTHLRHKRHFSGSM